MHHRAHTHTNPSPGSHPAHCQVPALGHSVWVCAAAHPVTTLFILLLTSISLYHLATFIKAFQYSLHDLSLQTQLKPATHFQHTQTYKITKHQKQLMKSKPMIRAANKWTRGRSYKTPKVHLSRTVLQCLPRRPETSRFDKIISFISTNFFPNTLSNERQTPPLVWGYCKELCGFWTVKNKPAEWGRSQPDEVENNQEESRNSKVAGFLNHPFSPQIQK